MAHVDPVAAALVLRPSAALVDERAQANAATPVFLAHGSLDPVVPERAGRVAAERLEALGQPLEWHSYSMPHAVCPEEIDAVRHWLTDRLADDR